MKSLLIEVMFFAMACSLNAKSGCNLSIYGTIHSVKISDGGVSIEFTGIGSLALGDPAFKEERFQYLSIDRAVIHLKFNGYTKGMVTYSGFRYIDFINSEQAVAILKDCQVKSADVRIILDAESLTYSKKGDGALRVSAMKGTLGEVAQWSHLFKESISEHTKHMGVRYDLVHGLKPKAESVTPSAGEKLGN